MIHHRELLLSLVLHFASLFDKSQGQDYGGNSSIFARLFNPYSTTTNNETMEGRLDIYYNGSWGSVCGDSFSDTAARVVCGSLGFGRAGRIIRNSYGIGNRTILFDYVYCNGDELSITNCSHSNRGYCNYGDVAISCSNSSIFIRLFDPNSTTTDNTTQGRLEIYFNGVWETVCNNHFTDAAARVVCSSLGFGRTGKYIRNDYGPGNRTILFDYVLCNGNELSIINCHQFRLGYDYNCYNQDVAVSCSNSSIFVRLFDPNSTTTNNNTTEGRLEIYFNGVWGTVCDNSYSDATALVVCSSLGYRQTGRYIRNTYGPGDGNVLFDYLYCRGYELSIADCSHSMWGSENNCNYADVEISCSNSPVFIRLFDPSLTTTNNDTMEGRLEIYFNGVWGTACNDAFSDAAAQIVCYSLGFGRIGRFIQNSYGPGSRNILFDSVSCSGNELSIDDCQQIRFGYNYNCYNREVAVSCNINECDSSPCLHTATCVDLVNDYKCSCAQGFTGRNCETEFNPCDTLACVNGTCFTDNSNIAACACIGGYRGRLCEEEIAECDSDPCQHDSTCVDGLNNYTCQCIGGYTGTSCEIEVNECGSNPCPINSICEDSINRYQCICPNPNEFIGIHCNISVSPPERSESPEFVEASPNHGPISGGTNITIKGRNLGKYGGVFFTYIGDMKLPTTNLTSSWSEFFVVTTAGGSSIVGQVQKFTFEITGGKNISSELTFTYYSDPVIGDVKPKEQLASGGTTLTVIGNNLNSSASPYLRVILNTTTSGRLNKNITIINGPTCDASSSSEIYCLMPRVNVVGTTVAVVNQLGSGSRKRRDANSPNITTYLTLILKSDAAEDAPSQAVELIAYRGFLEPVTGPMSFNPEVDPLIKIKGGMLSDGIGVDDYEISVGVGVCIDKSLTANELSCRPPTKEPDPGLYQALYCNEHGGLPVIVFAGRKVDNGDRKQFHWACLTYPSSNLLWWIILIICVGCALLLALLVVCFVLRRRRSKLLRDESKEQVYPKVSQSGDYLDPANADWTETQVNTQGELKGEPHSMRNDAYASRITDDIELNDYYNDQSMQNFRPNDDNRSRGPDWAKSSIYMNERGLQMTQYEREMIAAERNASALQNPVSGRYNHGLLSDDDSLDAAPNDKSNDMYDKSNSEISAVQDWRNQGRRLRPTIQQQLGGNFKGTDGDAISVAPALRANRNDFFGQNSGLRSPLHGSFEPPPDH